MPSTRNARRRAGAGGVAGAVTVILVWVAGEFGLVVPPEVASAFTTLLASGAALVIPDASAE